MRVRCSQVICWFNYFCYLFMQHIDSKIVIPFSFLFFFFFTFLVQGIQVQEYYGNFCKRIPTDVDLPGVCIIFVDAGYDYMHVYGYVQPESWLYC